MLDDCTMVLDGMAEGADVLRASVDLGTKLVVGWADGVLGVDVAVDLDLLWDELDGTIVDVAGVLVLIDLGSVLVMLELEELELILPESGGFKLYP